MAQTKETIFEGIEIKVYPTSNFTVGDIFFFDGILQRVYKVTEKDGDKVIKNYTKYEEIDHTIGITDAEDDVDDEDYKTRIVIQYDDLSEEYTDSRNTQLKAGSFEVKIYYIKEHLGKQYIKETSYNINVWPQRTDTENKNYYNLKTEDLFKEAEPYYYGSGSPLKNWYLPLGEDNDALTTEDIKIQAPEDNGYSEISYVEGYQIEGKNIPYIKKGTFPKMGVSSLIGSTNSGATIRIRVSYDSNNKTITDIKENKNLIMFGNDLDFYKTLSRIGFMLVGGGGGGGGSSWYDDKAKNKKGHLSFPYPGAGGGGGGILLGILAIDYNTIFKAFTSISKFTTKKSGFSHIGYSGEPKLEYVEYHFIVGGQSDGGKPSESNKMSYGTSGESGKSSKLVRCVACFNGILYSIDFGNFDNHEVFPSMSPQATPTQYYIYYTDYTIEALGGAGGGAGNHSSAVKGGVGGGYTFPKINNIYKNCVYIVKGITGGNGSGADKESDHNDAPAFNCNLYFSNTDASMSEYCTKINHPVRSSITDITDKSNPNEIDLSNTVVAGGASYGNGCYKDTSTHAASDGGGGASSGVATNRKGAKGLLALFY